MSSPTFMAIPNPHCSGMEEIPSTSEDREKLSSRMLSSSPPEISTLSAVEKYLLAGLAVTVGSALGSEPPSVETCLAAFCATNSVGLTEGARAWAKHSHRGTSASFSDAWQWGKPSGSVASINEKALVLFWKVMDQATWRNLHWLPHKVLAYEVRVAEGYGMRWAQDQSDPDEVKPWRLRGFVEPMMENGHEVGWRH
ncbi:hypothetical protein C8J56DRAFT_386502 [Mycena floridula]|nr:hypothetical protein C8J56DRAFT_386502 [Mycena floridula]